MIKIFVLVLLVIFSLHARENPFFPAAGEADIPLTSNEVTNIEPLKRAALSLPSTARTIESITVKYKNLDGSVSSKTEKLGNRVDWHLPLFVSQNINISQSSLVMQKRKSAKNKKFKNIVHLPFIVIYAAGKKIQIRTQDKMIRNFLLVKPHRIVCDFKRDMDFRSFEKHIAKNSLIKRVKIGNHKGYYRVVLELDGYYRYTNKKAQGSYTFGLL